MKKLRVKIVIAVLISATFVFALAILLTGTTLRIRLNNRSDSMTELLEANKGQMPPKSNFERMEKNNQIRLYYYDEESPYRERYFTVIYEGDKVKSGNGTHIAAVDEESAVKMADDARKRKTETGNYYDYRFRVSEDTGYVIFLDTSESLHTINSLLLTMSLVCLVFIVLITVVFHFVAKRVVRPFEENARTQKQFITDASHELKTPLAIISANAEVLAYKDGENEWIRNITDQTARISGLINELLTLNRLEEIEINVDIASVDFSEIVNKTADEFDEVFVGKGVAVQREIEPGVQLNGNKEQLTRLVSVLVENASKYVDDNGRVSLTLKKEMRYTVMRVFNTCEVGNPEDYKYLFDRFYRPDASRTSKTGGHGIGLSIAKRIVTLHNGTIEAQPEEDGLCFIVKLSNKLKQGKIKRNK